MHPTLRWFMLAAVLGVSSCQHLSAAVQPASTTPLLTTPLPTMQASPSAR